MSENMQCLVFCPCVFYYPLIYECAEPQILMIFLKNLNYDISFQVLSLLCFHISVNNGTIFPVSGFQPQCDFETLS